MRFRLFSKIAAALTLCLTAGFARADVLKIVIEDPIQPMAAEFIRNGIEEAQRTHSEAILIELNTPGGLMSSMHEIIEKVLASPVPVIIYVTPSGAHAASAGFFILESASIFQFRPRRQLAVSEPPVLTSRILRLTWSRNQSSRR